MLLQNELSVETEVSEATEQFISNFNSIQNVSLFHFNIVCQLVIILKSFSFLFYNVELIKY